jgi:general secretion pathway protein H
MMRWTATVHCHRSKRERGFTLIEMMMVIAIVGLLMAVSAYTYRNISRADLRTGAGKVSGAMRFAFDRAMMTGTYIRLAVDIDKGRVWLEMSKDRVSLRSGRKQLATDKPPGEEDAPAPKQQKPALPLGLGGGDDSGGGAIDVKGLISAYERDVKPLARPKARFNRLGGAKTRTVKLKKGVTITAVATPRMEEPVDKGVAYIYFFPQGHAEPAIVHFRAGADDDEGDYYSVVLHPLTGEAKVYSCRYRIPDEFGEPEDARRKKRDVCDNK